MGFNTVMSFCNDNFHDYERNPARFFRILKEGMYDGHVEPVKNMWGITVHPSEHADVTQVVAAGGNFSTRLLSTYYVGSHHTPEGQLAIVQDLAESLGYRLVRKSGGPS